MTKHARFFPLALLLSLTTIISCTKINEGTELGGDLIPVVDNVNTFETFLDVSSDNRIGYYNDSTRLSFYDEVAVGVLNDPEFGQTNANFYFNLFRDSLRLGLYPFIVQRDSITSIDSVVLQLAYTGSYGDSMATQNITVYEMDASSNFKDSSFYSFNHQPDIPVGSVLGTASYKNADLNDSIFVRNPTDSVARKRANVLRVRLNNSFGLKLKNIDSVIYRSYENFRLVVPGLGVRANSGNALTYFDLTAINNSKLTVYYKARINGRDSAAGADFTHYVAIPTAISNNPPNFINGKANIIRRTPGGGYATYGATGSNDPFIHIQSAPGSVAYLTVPTLSNFDNKVVHRAELIVTRIPSAGDDKFAPPSLLFLDHITNANDTGYTFHNDVTVNTQGQYDFQRFGGQLKNDNTYRFNVTRYVQGIITRNEPNDTLRLYAPYRTNVQDKNILMQSAYVNKLISLFVAPRIAWGRVVLAGGTHPDPQRKMRLRIIYSNL